VIGSSKYNLKCRHIFIKKIAFQKYCDGFAQSIARQRLGKYSATNVHARIEELQSVGSSQRANEVAGRRSRDNPNRGITQQ
jgi:hypothetical protein